MKISGAVACEHGGISIRWLFIYTNAGVHTRIWVYFVRNVVGMPQFCYKVNFNLVITGVRVRNYTMQARLELFRICVAWRILQSAVSYLLSYLKQLGRHNEAYFLRRFYNNNNKAILSTWLETDKWDKYLNIFYRQVAT